MIYQMANLIRVLLQDFQAYRRGDRRIAPRFDVNGRVVGGRVYARRNASPFGALSATARVVGNMSLRVYRVATDTWKDPVDIGPIYKKDR